MLMYFGYTSVLLFVFYHQYDVFEWIRMASSNFNVSQSNTSHTNQERSKKTEKWIFSVIYLIIKVWKLSVDNFSKVQPCKNDVMSIKTKTIKILAILSCTDLGSQIRNTHNHNVEISFFFTTQSTQISFMWNLFWSFWNPKNCYFDHLSTSEFWIFGKFCWYSQMWNPSKKQFLTIWHQPELISKIRVAGKLLKFHIQKSQLTCPGLYPTEKNYLKHWVLN